MKKFFQILGIIFAILIVMIVLAAIFVDGDKNTSNTEDLSTSTNVERADVEELPLVVTAEELIADYEANEIAADRKYKGKILEISGEVAGIGSGIGDKAVVNLVGGDGFQVASATGDDKFTAYASTLTRGQDVTLICRSDGEVIGFPQLSRCRPKY